MRSRLSDRLTEGRTRHPIYSLLGAGWTLAGAITEYKVITEGGENTALDIALIGAGALLITDGLASLFSGYPHEGVVRAIAYFENIFNRNKSERGRN